MMQALGTGYVNTDPTDLTDTVHWISCFTFCGDDFQQKGETRNANCVYASCHVLASVDEISPKYHESPLFLRVFTV